MTNDEELKGKIEEKINCEEVNKVVKLSHRLRKLIVKRLIKLLSYLIDYLK